MKGVEAVFLLLQFYCASYPAIHFLFSFWLLASSLVFQSSSVPGGRNTNSRTMSSPAHYACLGKGNYLCKNISPNPNCLVLTTAWHIA